MPWGFVAAAAVGAVGTAIASDNMADSADRATDAQSAAASEGTQLGREQLAFAREQYADARPMRERAATAALEISGAQLASMRQQDRIAADYDQHNRDTYRPLEQGLVRRASEYDTPDRRQAAADAAVADVGAGFSAARDATARRLAAGGVNVGSARSVAALGGMGVEEAKASAGAATTARRGVETTGHALQMDAASLGRNLPSAQATSAGLAISAGNSSVANAMHGVNATNAGVAGVQAGYNGAVQAALGAGSLYGSAGAGARAAAGQSAALWGNLGQSVGQFAQSPQGQQFGTAVGSWLRGGEFSAGGPAAYTDTSSALAQNGSDAGFYVSDENVKRNVAPVDDEEALEAIHETPVQEWEYDPQAAQAEGIDPATLPQGPQVGPMAQDVRRTMGDEVAPGGRRISAVKMNGIALRGVQAVDKKVDRLAKEVTGLAAMIRSGRVGQGARA